MVEWRDVSSYRQGERGKVEPRCWETDVGAFRVDVHRYTLFGDDNWFVSVLGLWDGYLLKATGADAAKEEALGMLAEVLRGAVAELEGKQ